jgi:hypothetical protein
MTPHGSRATALVIAFALSVSVPLGAERGALSINDDANQVLEWNQVFIDTLVATNTVNSSSQRLGAIVHTAIFDAYNGIERRYEPLYVHDTAPRGASRRAAVIAAAHRTLVALFPSRASVLDVAYAASIASLSDDGEDGGMSRERGLSWGEQVANEILAWRATDGFSVTYPAFAGGDAIGQWRPIPPAMSMSAQALAFTSTFFLVSNTQFQPPPPRSLASATYSKDFNTVKSLGRQDGSSRTADQTALAPFWEGNASVHWNQAANQIARANRLSMSDCSRLLAVLNVAMADTAFTIWSAKRYYGAIPTEVTWRPTTAIRLAGSDDNPDTVADPSCDPDKGVGCWQPLVLPTPSHPEYPAGHPAQNGAAATVLLRYFSDAQVFTLTTAGQPDRTYASIMQARSDGDAARIWGGMHYPSTIRISDRVGEAIAIYVNEHAMQRVHRRAQR